jgi:hypothetical protein
MIAGILAAVFICWAMMFYIGLQLIDVKHDLRSVRRHMDQIANRKIR